MVFPDGCIFKRSWIKGIAGKQSWFKEKKDKPAPSGRFILQEVAQHGLQDAPVPVVLDLHG